MEELIVSIARLDMSDLLPFLKLLNPQEWCRWVTGYQGKIFHILDDIMNGRLAKATASSSSIREFNWLAKVRLDWTRLDGGD